MYPSMKSSKSMGLRSAVALESPSAGRRRGRRHSTQTMTTTTGLMTTTCIVMLMLMASSCLPSCCHAAAVVPPSNPAYYDLLRTNPEDMGVIAANVDPTGRSNVVEFVLDRPQNDDIDEEQAGGGIGAEEGEKDDNRETYFLADITALLPYTIHYSAGRLNSPLTVDSSGISWTDSLPRPGVHNDAAALLLAIHHFNNRQTEKITGPLPQDIADAYTNCRIKLTTEIFDTGYSPIQSTRLLNEVLDRPHTTETAPSDPLPTAVLGAFRSASTSPTAILSGVNGLPQVSYRSSSTDFDNKEQYPYFGRTVPSSSSDARAVVSYLRHLGVEYVGVIFVTDAFGSSYQKSLQDAAGETTPPIRTDSVSFGYRMEIDPNNDGGSRSNEVKNAVATLASTGYRYFVALVGEEHYDRVMREATEQGLTGPEYVWIFVGGVDRPVWQKLAKYEESDSLANASNGIALIQVEACQTKETIPADTGQLYTEASPYEDTSHHRFRRAWSDAMSDPIMVEYFRFKQPKEGIEFSPEPSQFAYFIWDAIQSIGFGMCLAEKSTGSFFPGSDVYTNFVSNVNFEGASGQVNIVSTTGTRDAIGVTYTVWNARTVSTKKTDIVGFDLYPTSHIIPVSREGKPQDRLTQRFKIEEIQPFLYNDGTEEQPNPLPPPDVNLNHIGKAGRIVGYVLMSVVIALALGGLVWAAIKRTTKVVCASQPIFIAFVGAGCILMASAIIPLSMEETTVQSKAGLDMACMSAPWIYVLGFVIAFSALYTKTYSAYKVFRHSDIDCVTVRTMEHCKTLGALLVVNVAILLSWTLVAPLEWQRIEGDSKDVFDRSTESYAVCSSKSGKAMSFIIVLIVINLGALVFANFLAYKARDVATEYKENRYIAVAQGSILQAFAMGIPIMIVVKDSPQARFFVEVGIIFVTCSAVLLLIFVPKMMSVRTDKQRQMEEERRNTRRNISSRTGRAQQYDDEEEDDEDEQPQVGNPQAGQETESGATGSLPTSAQENVVGQAPSTENGSR